MSDDLFTFDLDSAGGRRIKRLLRILLGFAGCVLGLAGMYLVAGEDSPLPVPAWRVPGALLFVGLTAFSFFNIALGRRWRWPAWLMLGALPLLFVLRVLVPG